jgi:hypothetical protein
MRRHTAAVAVVLLFATACSAGEVDLVQADADRDPTQPTLDGAEGPDDDELLREYGALLAMAAVSGGDALERTLAVTAADGFDVDCAPTWAHTLLDDAGDEPAGVEVGDARVTVGDVDVPAEVTLGRALHLGGDCNGRLPQPDRTRPEPPPDPEPQQAAPELAGVQAPAPQASPQPQPVPQEPRSEPRASIEPPVRGDVDEDDLTASELARRYGDAVWRVETRGCGYTSTGTAFAVDERTLITNGHVVSNDMTPRLVSRDGSTVHQSHVLGWSMTPDVAVLRVDRDLDTILRWESASELEEGQQLVALGYPLPAADFTVARADILSFQMRGAQRQAVRTDGALDQGNSGGPVLTSRGKVAGVVTEMAAHSVFQNIPLSYTHDHLRSTIEALEGQRGAEADCSIGTGQPQW